MGQIFELEGKPFFNGAYNFTDDHGPDWRLVVWPTGRASRAGEWGQVARDIDTFYPISSLVRSFCLVFHDTIIGDSKPQTGDKP